MDAPKPDTAKLLEQIMEMQRRPHARFPYLIVRLLPAVYGVATLSPSLDPEQLFGIAVRESASRDHALSMCLVLADDIVSKGPRPTGGRVVLWTLAAPQVMAPAAETLQ